MSLIRKRVAGAALLVLAGCAGGSDGNGGAQGASRNGSGPNAGVDRIAAQRLETVSYGKERPVAVGSSEESWAKNRRAVAEVE